VTQYVVDALALALFVGVVLVCWWFIRDGA
jgi:hypothetical protein